MRRTILMSALIFLMAGCFTNTAFVLVQPVPDAPSFTVLPANDALGEVEFARRVEAALVSAGVIVLSPPPSAFVEERAVAGNAAVQTDAAAGHLAGKGDASSRWRSARFVAYDGLTSDYVVSTIEDGNHGGQVRIELRDSRNVIVVFHARAYADRKSVEAQVRDAVETILQGPR